MVHRDDPGYVALREGTAWLHLAGRGVIRATGEDRARLLHAMTTNHITGLAPGQGCYAFFLNAQGRILADVDVLCFADSFLLGTEPETRQKIYEHVDKYIIADDVVLEDLSDDLAVIGVDGPRSAETLRSLDAPLSEAAWSHAQWGELTVAKIGSTGAEGYRLFAPVSLRDETIRMLENAGAVAAGPEQARAVRLENGKPRYGEDFGEDRLPHETQLLHAVHFEKGCYLGQEIVERVRSRGLVRWLLVPLEFETAEPPAPGAKLAAGGKEAGEVTSALLSPSTGKAIGLGYVRRETLDLKQPLEIAGSPVRVRAAAPLA